MEQKDYIELGLNGEAPLKVILRGRVETALNERVGVVSIVYATMDREAVRKRLDQLLEQDKGSYYMVYSIPLDIDLTILDHYPSIAITREDLLGME